MAVGCNSLPNDVVIEMEDSRYKMAAIEAEDPRCGNLLNGVVIEMEDFRCKSLVNRVVIKIEDPRCNRVPIHMEDPRCKSLFMTW